jgi:solute carrier family 35 protein F1/2
MFFSWVYMRTRYHWTQIFVRFSLVPQHDPSWLCQGVMICVAGLGLLVGSDQLTNKDWVAPNKGKGDAFMILGATLYGFSASCTMMLVRETDRIL